MPQCVYSYPHRPITEEQLKRWQKILSEIKASTFNYLNKKQYNQFEKIIKEMHQVEFGL